jgi:hypothetical protein
MQQFLRNMPADSAECAPMMATFLRSYEAAGQRANMQSITAMLADRRAAGLLPDHEK